MLSHLILQNEGIASIFGAWYHACTESSCANIVVSFCQRDALSDLGVKCLLSNRIIITKGNTCMSVTGCSDKVTIQCDCSDPLIAFSVPIHPF